MIMQNFNKSSNQHALCDSQTLLSADFTHFWCRSRQSLGLHATLYLFPPSGLKTRKHHYLLRNFIQVKPPTLHEQLLVEPGSGFSHKEDEEDDTGVLCDEILEPPEVASPDPYATPVDQKLVALLTVALMFCQRDFGTGL